MHPEVHDFIVRMKTQFPAGFEAKRILEYGSLNVNGTPRAFFPGDHEYVGVDWKPGPGVDAVSLMHEYVGRKNEYFDFAISTEALEHDMYWLQSLLRVVRLLAPGGCLLLTCAGQGRHAHAMTTAPQGGYYANLTMGLLASVIFSVATFKRAVLEDDPKAHDLRFFGWRKR